MSEGFFATAEVLVVPNAADFATSLRAQLATAVAAAGPVIVPVTAAVAGKAEAAAAAGSLSAAQKTQNTLVGRGAVLLGEEAVAAKTLTGATTKTAIAEEEAALATKNHARAASQAERAIGAQAASLAGLRGAALTASAPFLAATVAIIAFGKSIREASDLNEEFNKTAVVFGSSAKSIQDFAKTTAASLGISEVEALRAAGIFGNLFRAIDIGQRPAAQMSERLVRLASDLASFNNADPSRTLEALRSGLVGQARPLRVFGIFLSQARAQEEALIETGKKNVKSLTNEELVRARFNIILKDSLLAQGDFGRTSDRLANQTRILTANLSNLGAQLGQVVVPAATAGVSAFNDLAGGIEEAITVAGALEHELKDLAGVGPIKIPVEIIRKGLDVGDEGPGGPPSIEESLKKAVVPAALIAASIGVIAAPETGGLSLLAAQAALVAGGLIATKQATDSYNKAARQATLESTRLAGALRGIGVDTKAAETPLLSAVEDVQKFVKSLSAQAFPADGLKALLPHLQAVISTLQTGPPLAQAFADKLQGIELNLQLAANLSPEELRKALEKAQKDLETFFKGHPLDVTADVVVKTRVTLDTKTAAAAFAGPAAELAQAQANREEGLKSLRALLGLDPSASRAEIQVAIDAGKFSKGRQAAINTAINEVSAADRVISGAASSAASKKKAAAAAAKTAAEKAARAQQEQTQAFIDLFSGPAQGLQNRLTEAQLSGSFTRQINVNKLIIAADKKEINAIKDRIRHLKLHGDALKLALATLKTLNQEIFNVRNAIDTLQEDRAQAVRDARQSHLEAQLAIAETTDTKKDDAAAEKALIAFDTAQIKRLRALKKRGKATRDEIALLDQYRVDLAQRNQALKELTATATKTHHLEFEFLQTQSGFAANLLGNLIPGLATGGLVGGTTAGGAPSGFPLPPTKSTPSDDARRAAGTTTGGPSRGGQATTNALLRRIEKLLSDIYRGTGHPEAKHRQRRNLTNMDLDSHH